MARKGTVTIGFSGTYTDTDAEFERHSARWLLVSVVYACTGEKRAFVLDDEQPSIGKLRDEVGLEFVGRCRQPE